MINDLDWCIPDARERVAIDDKRLGLVHPTTDKFQNFTNSSSFVTKLVGADIVEEDSTITSPKRSHSRYVRQIESKQNVETVQNKFGTLC